MQQPTSSLKVYFTYLSLLYISGITFVRFDTNMVFMKKLLLVLALVPTLLLAQSRKERKALEAQRKVDQQITSNLKNHVQQLSQAATASGGEAAGVEYISNQFKIIGLQPKGTAGYLQPFSVDDGKNVTSATFLTINGKKLQLHKDYFPLSYSAQKQVSGMPAMALREKGVPWFLDVKDMLEGRSASDNYNLSEAIRKEVAKVAEKGASALFLYNSGEAADSIGFDQYDKTVASPIPVIYITRDCYKNNLTDDSQMLDIEMNVAFEPSKKTGTNVLGFIDNSAPSTIVVGTYYKSSEQNQSAATLIELAKMMTASKAKTNNYLFIAFGGDNMGADAADYYIAHSTVPSPANYMIHFATNTSANDNAILVKGAGSSPAWNQLFTAFTDKEIKVETAVPEAGCAACFYKKAIPVLSFTTAGDNDAADSYEGELAVARCINKLVEATDTKGKLAYTKVAEQAAVASAPESQEPSAVRTNYSSVVPKTTVSLGVIADQAYKGDGLKIYGVSPNKLAATLGVQAGDILTYLGTQKIDDMSSYIHALSNFKPGDKTVLRIKRGKEDKEFAVEF